MEQVRGKSRSSAVDHTKALAICAVVLIHCSAGPLAAEEIGSFSWLAAVFYGGGARWAVAAFLLCSGALMNDPDRALPVKKLLTRYLPRLFLAFFVWGALYEGLGIYAAWGSAPLGQLLAGAAKNFLHGTNYYHLYYFYFAIALYLALPLTRLAARASREELGYILALWLLLGIVVRFLQYFWPVSRMARFLQYYLMPAAAAAPGLGLLGWYLRRRPPRSWLGPLALFLTGFAASSWEPGGAAPLPVGWTSSIWTASASFPC